MVYHNVSLSNISMREYINTFVKYLNDIYDNNSHHIKINAQVDDVFLKINTAIPLCLILNELLSNSFKHGFPDNRPGIITLSLKKQDDNNNIIVVLTDNGVGLPEHVNAENTTSLGLRLVYSLIKQINGHIKLEHNGGLTFILSFSAD